MAAKKPKHKPDLKVVIVGEKSVGKTSLIRRYLDRKFTDSCTSTIGASFLLKQWRGYNVAIWDTAGEERFVGLSTFYCRGAGAAILAFDPTDERSFDLLKERFVPLLDAAEENCFKVVVGTKFDLVNEKTRKISNESGCSLARLLNPSVGDSAAYFETSSSLGTNVDETFEFIFEHVLNQQLARPREDTLTLEESTRPYNKQNHTNCCK